MFGLVKSTPHYNNPIETLWKDLKASSSFGQEIVQNFSTQAVCVLSSVLRNDSSNQMFSSVSVCVPVFINAFCASMSLSRLCVSWWAFRSSVTSSCSSCSLDWAAMSSSSRPSPGRRRRILLFEIFAVLDIRYTKSNKHTVTLTNSLGYCLKCNHLWHGGVSLTFWVIL